MTTPLSAICSVVTAIAVSIIALPTATEYLHLKPRTAAEEKIVHDLILLAASIEQGLNEPDLAAHAKSIEADTIYAGFVGDLRPARYESLQALMPKLVLGQAIWKAILPDGACYTQLDVALVQSTCKTFLDGELPKLKLKIEDVSTAERNNAIRYTNRRQLVSPVLTVLSTEIGTTLATFK